jgi:hypothetical protein
LLITDSVHNLIVLLYLIDNVMTDFCILPENDEIIRSCSIDINNYIIAYLTHKTKSPKMVVESRTKKTPPSRSFMRRSVASDRLIEPKYQLKAEVN